MSVRPLMYLKPLALFENPVRGGLHFDDAPSENLSPRADLFSGGVGEKKNVTEWVKNGETTAEAKVLANSLQAQMEAIKRETDLQLVQEYRFVFDQYILNAESYDSPETLVNDRFKNKGALYVLEQSCPVLKAQFKAYPDLRYLAYASATKEVPDVDVLPMNSTVSMVDGTVYLKRPGKPDAEFKLFPWDYRSEIEKKYQELKPAPKQEAVAEVAQADAVAQAPEPAPIPAPIPAPSQMAVPEEADKREAVSTEEEKPDTYKEAVQAGNIGLARELLVKARKDGTAIDREEVQKAIDGIDQNYGRVRFELKEGQRVVADGIPSENMVRTLRYLSDALSTSNGAVEVLLPVGPYKVLDSSGTVVKTFRISKGRNPVIDN